MHIGVIPDGNRRYANNHGVGNYKAYRKARDTIKDVTESLNGFSQEVDTITFYLLSEENLRRDEDELETLFQLLEDNVDDMGQFFQDRDFNANWASTRPEALPEDLSQKLEALEEEYNGEDTKVNLLISYSGKRDIVQASRSIAESGEAFNEEEISDHLEIESDIDFVIRTGDNPDRECLSGFPIWNASYAEYYHIRKNFPAINADDVENALDHYKSLRKKNGE